MIYIPTGNDTAIVQHKVCYSHLQNTLSYLVFVIVLLIFRYNQGSSNRQYVQSSDTVVLRHFGFQTLTANRRLLAAT